MLLAGDSRSSRKHPHSEILRVQVLTVAPLLQTLGLRVRYPGAHRDALAGIDLALEPGTLLGVLGPNGAGKTTLLRCALGLLRPSDGEIRLLGAPWTKPSAIAERRRLARVGLLIESPGLYRKLSPREYLEYFAALAGVSAARDRIESLARQFDFSLAVKTCGELSQGNRQKLHLMRSLLAKPELLLWDEPTDHLDPTAQAEALAVLSQHVREQGGTALLASHRIEHLERVCSHVAILVDGQIRLQGKLADLLGQSLGMDVAWSGEGWPTEWMAKSEWAPHVRPMAAQALPPGAQGGLHLDAARLASGPDLVSALSAQGYRIMHVTQIRPTLEHRYHQAIAEKGSGVGEAWRSAAPIEKASNPLAKGFTGASPSDAQPCAPVTLKMSTEIGIVLRHELRLISREPRFLILFLSTSLFLVGAQAFLLSNHLRGDAQAAWLLAQPILLLLAVMAPGLCVPLAADSFAGERERNTLDLLLCSPVRPQSVFWGKVLGLLPFPIAFGWFGQGLLLGLLSWHGVSLMQRATELGVALAVTPCMALLVASIAASISLRSETVRAATQGVTPWLLATFMILPFLSGAILRNPWLGLGLCGVCLLGAWAALRMTRKAWMSRLG